MRRPLYRALWVASALWLSACATHPPAPIVERSTRPPPAEIPVDGLYRVRGGDTLYGIAFRYGLDFRDIARWSGIAAPYTIYPDQVVRLRQPPRSQVTTTAVPKPSSRSRTQAAETVKAPPPKPVPPPPPAPSPGESASAPASASASTGAPSASSGGWAWPAEGRLLRTFKADDPTRKGVDIVGREGDPVRAASGGEVVYSGNGLIGYGELVIVKHDDRMLSAYAHNRRRMVREGDRVTRGQQIAELGRNDRNETVLHFEIRRDGEPVDPLRYLPRR
jgi:lipoprotein NlpD